MKRKSGLLWFVLLLGMNSCVSYEKFSMEVFKPAKFTLPPDIRKVAIVSRNLKFENDTLQNYQVKNGRLIKDKIWFNWDSLAIRSCIDSLASQLLSQDRLDSILILPVNSFPETWVKELRYGKAEWYKNLANETGADGLIILDMFSSFYTSSDAYPTNNYSPDAKVITSNVWTFYDCKKQKINDRFVQIDTLYWDGLDEDGQFKKLRIPGKKEAISIAGGVIGENYSKHIQPDWTMVHRDIMTCDKPELKQAAKLAQKNKWDEAIVKWQKYEDSNSKRNKIISLYNLALASEVNGDLDRAIKLIDLAAKASSGQFWSAENEAVRDYWAIIYRRKIEIDKLTQQHEFQ